MAFYPVLAAATSIPSARTIARRTIALQEAAPRGRVPCQEILQAGRDQNLVAPVS